jgi:hypothetical protein
MTFDGYKLNIISPVEQVITWQEIVANPNLQKLNHLETDQ